MSGEFIYDEALGKAAFDRIEPALMDLPDQDLIRVNLDLQTAATACLQMGEFAGSPNIVNRLEELPPSIFDRRHIANLSDLGWGAWFVHYQGTSAAVRKHNARVKAELVEDAFDTKRRMLRVATYYFEDHAEYGPELVDIRLGRGYLDLATDLSRLATLYDVERDILVHDEVAYRTSDAHDARAYVAELVAELHGPDTDAWDDRRARVFTLMNKSYGEVCQAGRYVFRNEPAKRMHFHTLRTAVRRPTKPHRPAVDTDNARPDDVVL